MTCEAKHRPLYSRSGPMVGPGPAAQRCSGRTGPWLTYTTPLFLKMETERRYHDSLAQMICTQLSLSEVAK